MLRLLADVQMLARRNGSKNVLTYCPRMAQSDDSVLHFFFNGRFWVAQHPRTFLFWRLYGRWQYFNRVCLP